MSDKKAPKPLPRGLTWRGDFILIDIRVGGVRYRKSTLTANVKRASEMLDTIRAEMVLSRMTGVEPKFLRKKTTLESAVKKILKDIEREGLAPKTWIRYEGIMRKFSEFCSRDIGTLVTLDKITTELIERYRYYTSGEERTANGHANGKRKLASPRTVANELDTLRAFFNRVVKHKLLSENPVVGVARPKDAYKGRVRWLNERELEDLYHAAETWDEWKRPRRQMGSLFRHLIELFVHTGMRLEEMRYLTLDDCLLNGHDDRSFIRVREKDLALRAVLPCSREQYEILSQDPSQLVGPRVPAELRKCDWSLVSWDEQLERAEVPLKQHWGPKTDGRMIPLNARAIELIEHILNWRSVLCRQNAIDETNTRLLIPDKSGLPWRWHMPWVMKHCSERMGIAPVIKTHDLRHTFATRLRQRGIPIETIKDLLGHKDIRDTLIYSHYSLAEGAQAVDALIS